VRFSTIPEKTAKTSYYNTNKKEWKMKKSRGEMAFFGVLSPDLAQK
jgi:hypothetical protein